jgi:TP901 family phage tail tape measure protein
MANKAVGFLTFNFGANMAGFNKAMKKARRSVRKFGSSMKSMGRSMTTNMTMPLLAVGAAGVKLAVDFSTSMTKIRTLVGASASDLKDYEKDVLSISQSTGVAAEQLAEGLFFITSAGLKGKEAIEALEVSAKGAAMGMGEMADIGNALTSIMTAYADEGMTAAKGGDLLHETLKQGKFEASEFMQKLGKVIPTAAAAGISFEELGAAAATMSKLSGDAAGTLTSINSLMMKLLKPSAQQKEILDELGISADDLGKMMDKSLMGTLQFLFKGLEGNNEMLMKVFGSSKAVTGALSTMGLQSETYAEVLDGMNNSQGNVAAGMEILSETAGFKLSGAMNSVKLVLMDIGNRVMPLVLKAVQKIESAMQWWQGLDESVKKTIISVAILVAGLGPLLSVVGNLTIAFSTMFSTTGLLIGLFAVLGASLIWIYNNIQALTTLIANQFASKFGASFWSAMGAAMKTMGISGGDALLNLGAKMAVVVATGDELPQEEFLSFTDIIKNASSAMKDFSGIELGGGTSAGGSEDEGPTIMPSLGGLVQDGPLLATAFVSVNTELEKTKTLLEVLEEKFGLTKEAMMAFAQQTATGLGQGAESFAEYGEQVKNVLRDTISAMIAAGVAGAVKTAMASIPPFPGSVALIPIVAGLASGLAKTAFNSLIPKFADGGIVSGPTVGLMGEYAGAGAGNPEVIAPLNKLKNMMGSGQQNVVVEGRINGNDIWLSNSKTNLQRNRGI